MALKFTYLLTNLMSKPVAISVDDIPIPFPENLVTQFFRNNNTDPTFSLFTLE